MQNGEAIGILVPKHEKRYPMKGQQAAMRAAGVKGHELGSKVSPDPDSFSRMSCPGRVFAIMWLWMICTKKAPAKTKRDIILKFVDDIEAKGGTIWELGSNRRTDDRAQKRAMVGDAMEAVTKGRQPALTHQRGRPKKVFTKEQLEAGRVVWESRKLKSWAEVAKALPRGMTVHNAWREFGARDKTD